MLAQAKEAIDAAAQAERLGLIGVLALVGLVAVSVIIWLVRRVLAEYKATIERLIEERNAALRKVENLHAYIDDIVLPAVGAANNAVSRSMRRVVDEQ